MKAIKKSKLKLKPIYGKEALRRAYNAYHALGGNDVATRLYDEVMDLPTEDPNAIVLQ